jgi:hypothetical protein
MKIFLTIFFLNCVSGCTSENPSQPNPTCEMAPQQEQSVEVHNFVIFPLTVGRTFSELMTDHWNTTRVIFNPKTMRKSD